MEDLQIKQINKQNKEDGVSNNNLNKFIPIKTTNAAVKAAILNRSLSVEDSGDEDQHTCLGVHPETGRLRWCVHNKHLRLLIVVPAALLPITILFILLSRLEFVEPYRHGGQRSTGLGGVSRGGRDNVGLDRINMGQFGDVNDCTAREIRLNNPELLDVEEREILRDIRTSFIPPRDSYIIQNGCKNVNNLIRHKRTFEKPLIFQGNISSDIVIWTSNNKSNIAKVHKESNFTLGANKEDTESEEYFEEVTESLLSNESEAESDTEKFEGLPRPEMMTEKKLICKNKTRSIYPILNKKKTYRGFRDSLGSEEQLETGTINVHQKNAKDPDGSLDALNFQIIANRKSLEEVERKMKEQLQNDQAAHSLATSTVNATSPSESTIENSTPPTLQAEFWKGQGSVESIRKAQADAMLHYMDQTVSPCEDFYQYACGNWAKVNPIPADKAGYDTFEMLRESLDAVLKQLLTENEDNGAAQRSDDNVTDVEQKSLENPLIDLPNSKSLKNDPIINNHVEQTTAQAVTRRKRNAFETFVDRFKNIGRRKNSSEGSSGHLNLNQANLLRQIRKVIKKQYASYFDKNGDFEVQNDDRGNKYSGDNDKFKYWLKDNDLIYDLQNEQKEKDVIENNNNLKDKNEEISRVFGVLKEKLHSPKVYVYDPELEENDVENDALFSSNAALENRRSVDGIKRILDAERNPEDRNSETVIKNNEKEESDSMKDDKKKVEENLQEKEKIKTHGLSKITLKSSESSNKNMKDSNKFIIYDTPDDNGFREGKLREKLKIHYEASKLKHHKVNVRIKREGDSDTKKKATEREYLKSGFVYHDNDNDKINDTDHTWKTDNDFSMYRNRIKRKGNQMKLTTDVLNVDFSNNSYIVSPNSTAEGSNATDLKTVEFQSTKHNDAIKKAKDLYASCMNYNILEQRGNGPLLELLEQLGGWPVINSNWSEENFDWLELAANLRLFNNDILIAEWVGPDIKNSDEYVIQFDQTSLGLPTRDYFLQASNQQYLDAYKEYLIKICVLMGATEERASTTADEIIEFEIKLAKITSAPEERRNVSVLYQRLTVGRLKQLIPQIDWLRYLNIVLDRPANSSETIVMFALNYMEDLVTLLSNTDSRTISNYLMWRFVRHRVNNLDDRFQGAKQKFYFVLFGREQSPPRWKNCVAQVNSNMGMALGAMFVRRYFDETSKQDTTQMTSDIQQSFRELLNMTDWIDSETKQLAGLKVDAMLLRIGYPDYILNNDVLNEKYQDVEIDKELYFENTLNILKHLTRQEQSRLGELVNKTLWHTAPAVVNAYYSRNKNQIMFPAGILQPPFYHRHFPRSLNYGGIGVVIGHELTHGFDDKGRLFDRDGNLHRWWSDQSIEGFHERAQCLIDQYSNYTVSEVGMAIDGFNTQGENIADNGGIKQAFRAYERWLKIHGDANETLPGINATNKQLFFLNFAQVWCGAMRPEATRNKLKTAVHSPGRFRVVGTLSNSDDFAREYNCAPGTKMNPSKKCSVW